MLVVGESAGKHIQDYSSQFQSEFVAMLSRRYVPSLLPTLLPADQGTTGGARSALGSTRSTKSTSRTSPTST